jgi:hypothetical protein
MRIALLISLLWVAGCASQKLALAPPAGVDLSGHWRLNEADSDDPQRVAMSQTADSSSGAAAQGGGSPGGQGGRGGGRSGRGGSGGYGAGPLGPATPAVGALSDGLRWPGKTLDIQQAAGVVTITSLGTRQVYQPAAVRAEHHRKAGDDGGGGPGRELRGQDRLDGPPPACGWDDKTLVVQSETPDDDHPPFEERYSLSSDHQRLIEVVAFKGGRSGGFVVSRVWDRVPADAVPGAAANGRGSTQ